MLVVWGANEIHGHVFDDRHVLRSGAGSQPCEVVVEDHIEHPMKPVLYAPMVPDGGGEGFGVEPGGGQIIAALAFDLAAAFGPGFDHADHCEMGEARFAGVAPIGPEP